MSKSIDDLRRDAAEDRELAKELTEDNPGYAEYLERRASWREKLALHKEEFNDS